MQAPTYGLASAQTSFASDAFAFGYLNYILIFNSDGATHLQHLCEIFTRLQKAGPRLKYANLQHLCEIFTRLHKAGLKTEIFLILGTPDL